LYWQGFPSHLRNFRHLNAYFELAVYLGFLIFVVALPFGDSTGPLYGGLLLALFGWVGRIVYERKLEWRRTALDLPIAIFLGLALISAFAAPHPSTSSFGYFWKLLRAVLLFYAVVHSRLEQRWRSVVIAFIVAGAVSATLGLWYYVNGTHLGVDFLFSTPLKLQEPPEVGSLIPEELRREFERNGWRISQDAVISPPKRADEWRVIDKRRDWTYSIREKGERVNVYVIEPRLAGTFKMPNDLGAYLVILIPMTLGYFAVSFKKRWRFAPLFGIILCLMTANLALTLTRAAWVGVFVAALYTSIVLERRLLWAMLIVVVLSPIWMPKPVKARFQTLLTQPPGFLSERPQWWKTSVQLISKYPVTGIGLGRFRDEYQRHAPPGMYHTPYHAHNIYLQIAVEQGIPSLLLFLWMLAVIFRQIFTLRRSDDFWRLGLFIGGSGFLISALVYGLADHILHQRPLLMFWFVIGLIFYVKDEKMQKMQDTKT
jgi:hypothetical protein